MSLPSLPPQKLTPGRWTPPPRPREQRNSASSLALSFPFQASLHLSVLSSH